MKSKRFIPLSAPCFGSEEKLAVCKALDSGWVTLGPKTAEFEDQFASYIGSKYAVATSSATAGLHLAVLVAGIGPGDEVIAPVFTFAATINPVIHVGARPILVDVRHDTFTIDVREIEKKITKKTKAIIPVHYAGQAADMDEIRMLAKKYNLKIIEDAAHAVGAKYKNSMIGTIGDMTVFSFHPIKNMTTGDGGMVTTNNPIYNERLRLLRLHGMNKEAWKRFSKSGSWYYEITAAGFKYNMTDISAVIGIEQLKKLNRFNRIRNKYVDRYNTIFASVPEITVPAVLSDRVHAWNLYSILLDVERLTVTRDEFIELLKEKNIGSSVYFTPLHLHPYYRENLGVKRGDFPNAERIYQRIISLPLSPTMTVSDVRYVAETISTLVTKLRRKG